MKDESNKKLNRTNKVLKILFILSVVLVSSNLLHGLISPKTFVSIAGEGVLLIELGILV